MKKIVITALMPLVLCACTMTPEECSPTGDPGMLDKLGCVISGSYSKRVETKKQEIADLREEQKQVLAQVEELSKERAALINDRAAMLKKLDELEDKLAVLQDDLRRKGALNQALQAKFDSLKKAREELANTPSDAAPIEIKQKYNQVESEYEELLDAMSAEF